MRHAPPGAFFLVLTHEHALDLRIVEAILRRGDFAFCGLIGSKTKRAKFVHRLEERGIATESIARLTCPIGVANIDGKEPEVIAAGVIAQLLVEHGRALRTIGADDETTASRCSWRSPCCCRPRRRRTSTGCSRTASPPRRLSRSGYRTASAPAGPARCCRAIRRASSASPWSMRAASGRSRASPGPTRPARSPCASPGVAIALYRSRPSPVRLEAEAFESYLRDEGLDRVIATRAAHGESQQPGTEIFSRNAKAMLVAPGPAASGSDAQRWRRPVGLTLELVPETDPRPLAAGGAFAMRLLYRGKPLAGALVKAYPKDGNERRLAARTDAQGRVRFVLPEGGVWLISAVHMIDAPAASGARWESLWASLTFDAGAAGTVAAGDPRR